MLSVVNVESGEVVAENISFRDGSRIIRKCVKEEKKGGFESYLIVGDGKVWDNSGQEIVITEDTARYNAGRAIETAISSHWDFGALDKETRYRAIIRLSGYIGKRINVRDGVYVIPGRHTKDGKAVTVRWEGKFKPKKRKKYSEAFWEKAMALIASPYLNAAVEPAKGSELKSSHLAGLYYTMLNHDCGVVGAFRSTDPRDDGLPLERRRRLSRRQNLQRTRHLYYFLISPSVSLLPIDGVGIENYGTPDAKEVRELSFLISGDGFRDVVVDIRKRIVEAGKRYGRDFVLFIPKDGEYAEIIGTREGAWPGLDQVVPIAKESFGKGAAFMAKAANLPFYFYECGSYPYHIGNLMSMMGVDFQRKKPIERQTPFFSDELAFWKDYGKRKGA